jgi:ribosome-associated protein
VDAADQKIGLDPVVLDVGGLIDAFDALVVVAGRNDRQVRAIAEEVELRVARATGLRPLHVEGAETAEWIALDYGFVIVHVFDEATREYYDLEHLWSAARRYRRAGSVPTA